MRTLLLAAALILAAVPALAAGYAYSNNGLSLHAWDDAGSLQPGEVWFDHLASPTELSAAFPGYGAASAVEAAVSQAQIAMAAGFTVSVGGTGATYVISTAQEAVIDGIYTGIKNGDGLPGGGASFNFADAGGAMHSFSATQFTAFAKEYRDYLYALSQAQTPAVPAAIP